MVGPSVGEFAEDEDLKPGVDCTKLQVVLDLQLLQLALGALYHLAAVVPISERS